MNTPERWPDIETPYRVTAEQVARYVANGYVKLPRVLSPEAVLHYEPEITGKVIELDTMHLPLEQRDTYHKAFLQVGNLWEHSQRVRELVFSRRLARLAAELLGVRGVRLYHDQALYKEAGGGHTPWHRDQQYWPLSSDRMITVWLPLQETPLEMGPLTFAAGSHHSMEGRDLELGDASDSALEEAIARHNYSIDEGPFALGDASFHAGWTAHRAPPNTTTTPRRVMTVIYMDADIQVIEPDNDWRVADWKGALSSAPVGSIPNGPLNPVLWSADEMTSERHSREV